MGFAALLDLTATHQRPTVDQTDGEGNSVRAYETVASGVPCAVQKRGGAAVLTDGGYVREERWLGFFAADRDVRVLDRIVVASGTYEVVAVETPRGHHTEATLRAVAGA